MPVTKVRDVGDLRSIVSIADGAVERALAHVEAMTCDLPSPFLPGIRRFSSVEEAQADRDAAVLARMRALRRSRTAGER